MRYRESAGLAQESGTETPLYVSLRRCSRHVPLGEGPLENLGYSRVSLMGWECLRILLEELEEVWGDG